MEPNDCLSILLKEIGTRLYEIRHLQKKKMTAVAQEVGISHAVISLIENGRYTALSLELLTKIANHYKIELAEIFFSKEQRSVSQDPYKIIEMLVAENISLREKIAPVML